VKFLADESVEGAIVERLRSEGHTVEYVAETMPGIPDSEVLDAARENQAILLTSDKDFGELVFRQRALTEGVVLIRLTGLTQQEKDDTVSGTVSLHAKEIPMAFTVISRNSVRIRTAMRSK